MLTIWDRVCGSGVRNFDVPVRPVVERADFTADLLNTIAGIAAWAAMVASDLDDPVLRGHLTRCLAEIDRCLWMLRIGVGEATMREAK